MEEFKNIDDILEFAINSEQEAVDFYTELANNASNEEMKEVFTQFAGEEMGHKRKLMNIKESGTFEVRETEIRDLKIADYLVDVEPHPNMSYQEALMIAMKKEKSAFKLYSNLAAKAPTSEMKDLFNGLALEESKHKLRFELEYDEFVLREN